MPLKRKIGKTRGANKATSRSSRAGLLFPVERVGRYLKQRKFAERIEADASVYLAAVLEYLSAKVLGLAGNATKDNHKKKIILLRHIQFAFTKDVELNRFYKFYFYNLCRFESKRIEFMDNLAKEKSDYIKRPISAFFYYQKDRRESLKREQPSLDSRQIVSKMSEEWNTMNDNQRIPFKKLADSDRARYKREKMKYNVESGKQLNVETHVFKNFNFEDEELKVENRYAFDSEGFHSKNNINQNDVLKIIKTETKENEALNREKFEENFLQMKRKPDKNLKTMKSLLSNITY